MKTDESPVRTSLLRSLALFGRALARSYRFSKAIVLWIIAVVGAALRALREWLDASDRYLRGLHDGPAYGFLTRAVKHGLLGRHLSLSALTLLVAPFLALGANWWVVRTTDIGHVVQAVMGTWDGTDPHFAVFLGATSLIALAAVSAAVNSGLLPTTLLVSAPVFGIGFSFYGTVTATGVVSLPEAVTIAAAAAGAFGVPFALAGYVIGLALRRVTLALSGRARPGWRPDSV